LLQIDGITVNEENGHPQGDVILHDAVEKSGNNGGTDFTVDEQTENIDMFFAGSLVRGGEFFQQEDVDGGENQGDGTGNDKGPAQTKGIDQIGVEQNTDNITGGNRGDDDGGTLFGGLLIIHGRDNTQHGAPQHGLSKGIGAPEQGNAGKGRHKTDGDVGDTGNGETDADHFPRSDAVGENAVEQTAAGVDDGEKTSQ